MTQATTYILVHGAWSGAWCWRDLGEELTQRDVQWVALDLPSSAPGAPDASYLADDAREVIDVANVEGPVVLVGHSYGGAVITEAADRIEKLQGLIYVAALVPRLGQSASEAKAEVDVNTALDQAIERDGGHLTLNPTLAPAALYGDCTKEVATWATERLTPQTLASFRSPRSAFDVEVPSRYIMCRDDQALDPRLQHVMAERSREVLTIASGHCPFLSHPTTLCDLILQN